jgi:hypothetical protein
LCISRVLRVPGSIRSRDCLRLGILRLPRIFKSRESAIAESRYSTTLAAQRCSNINSAHR